MTHRASDMNTLLLGVLALTVSVTWVQSAALTASDNHTDFSSNRQQRFFSSVKLNSLESSNEIDSSPSALEKMDEDPNTALTGVYSDCLMNLSFPCLQRKILVFLDRLGRMAKFNLIGNFLSVVRTGKEARPPLTEDALIARNMDDEFSLRTMIDSTIDQFFENHVIRLAVPEVLKEEGRSTSVLDFRVGESFGVEEGDSAPLPPLRDRVTRLQDDLNDIQNTDAGRMKKKKGGGGKMKGMKKMMMMGCMMMMGKAALLGPLMMGISSLAAIKALIFSTIALTISKIMILKKLKMMMGKGGMSGWSSGGSGGSGWSSGSGGGGGGGWSSGGGGGGGGGWSSGGGGDRSFDTHSVVYRGYR